jgi:hypothetical protein
MARTETNGISSAAAAPGPGRVNGSTAATVDGTAAAEHTGTGTDSDGGDGGTPGLGGFIFEQPTAPGTPGTGPSSPSSPSSPGKRQQGGWNRGKRKVNGKWTDGTATGPSSPGTRTPNPGAGPSSKAKVSTSLEGIEGILLSVHMMLATFTQIKELELSPDEAAKLSAAIARVAALYDVGASEKTLAWTNLMVCAGGIYGTRAFAYKIRHDSEEEAKKAPKLVTFAGQAYTQTQQAQQQG